MFRKAIMKKASEMGLKPTSLARLAGVRHQAVCGYFAGKSLRIENFEKLCKALKLELK